MLPINGGEDRRAHIRVVAGEGGVVAWVDAVGIVGIASARHREDNVKIAVRRDGAGGNEQWEDNQVFDVTDKWKSDRKIREQSQSLIYAPGFVPPLKAQRYLFSIVQVMQPSIKTPIKFNEVRTLALAISFIVCILELMSDMRPPKNSSKYPY